MDGIRWRVRVGAPWRDVPERYGHWQSVYGLFRCWQRAGIWPLVWAKLMAFAEAGGLIGWSVSVDSTVVRAHQHAAGARRDGGAQVEPPAGEPPDHGLGRSRGGLTTKTSAIRSVPVASSRSTGASIRGRSFSNRRAATREHDQGGVPVTASEGS